MDFFLAPNFFDLAEFAHRAIFSPTEAVWDSLKQISQYLASLRLGEILGEVAKEAYLVNREKISIGKGSIVEPGAYIQGPCIIGEQCEVRHGAYIRGNVITGNRCVIGHATEVKNSIFLNHALAGHFAYIGDTILGNHVNLGAGTKCANLRFDNLPIHIVWQGKKFETGLRKLGAILGDRVQTGCNSVTNPGTILGKECKLSPCMTARGFIPEKTIIR